MSGGQHSDDFGRHFWKSTYTAEDIDGDISVETIAPADFRILAENLPTLCWIANGDGYIVWYNRRWHEYCGTDAAQMEGWGWTAVHDPDILPGVMKRWVDAIALGEPFEMTFPLRGGDGVYRPFLTRIQPVRDRNGRLARWFGVNTEISAQVAAETALRDEHRRSRGVLESMEEAFLLLDHDFRVVEINAEALRLEQRSRDAIIGLTCWKAWPGVETSAVGQLYKRAILEKRAVASEHEYTFPDGRAVWIDMRAYPQPDGLAVFYRDVSARKRDETALRTLNETLEQQVVERTAQLHARDARLRTVFESSHQLQGLLTPAGVVVDINATALAAIGADREQIVGELAWRTPWFTGTPEAPALMEAAVVSAARGADMRQEINLLLPSGRRTFDLSIRPSRDGTGSVVALVTESIDITERRQAEEQLRQSQKMEAVGQLTGGLAHDFNNLLTGIVGSLDMLVVRLAQGRVKDTERYILAAQGAAKRAAALTHRLLAFSRRQTLDPKPTDVNRLVADVEELIRRTVGPAIALQVVGASGLWPVLIDPNQLDNALLNLCINARDAMPDGGRLTIETANKWLDDRTARENDVAPGQFVALSVTDTGSGMTPDVIKRAFDPFFTTKPLGEGTGLGLSMIYGFVRQSGGIVRIYSEVGHGTTMRLYLPRFIGPTDEAEIEPNEVEAPRAETGETILIVDDEPTVRMLISDVLGDLGYHTINAVDGPSGLKILRSTARIDLMITDVGLPGGINGRQLADAGRLVRPALKVLFITGYAENAAVGGGHLAHGMRVLTKPFEIETLASRIGEMMA